MNYIKKVISYNDVDTIFDVLVYPTFSIGLLKDIENADIQDKERIIKLIIELYGIFNRKEYKKEVCYVANRSIDENSLKLIEKYLEMYKDSIWAINLKNRFLKYKLNSEIRDNETRRMKLLYDIKHFPNYKLKSPPEIIHYNYTYSVDQMVEKIINQGVKYVGVDFDRTLIMAHTRNYSFDVDEYVKNKQHQYVVDVCKKLMENDIEIAVVSFCDNNEKLIREFCQNIFQKNIPIYTTYHRGGSKSSLLSEAFLHKREYIEEGKEDEYEDFNKYKKMVEDGKYIRDGYYGVDKNGYYRIRSFNYIKEEQEDKKMKIKQILLIDDDKDNINDCLKSGFQTIHVQINSHKNPGEIQNVYVDLVDGEYDISKYLRISASTIYYRPIEYIKEMINDFFLIKNKNDRSKFIHKILTLIIELDKKYPDNKEVKKMFKTDSFINAMLTKLDEIEKEEEKEKDLVAWIPEIRDQIIEIKKAKFKL